MVKISKITRRQFIKQQECLAAVNGYVEEYISGQKVIKAFNREEDIIDGFEQVNEMLKKEGFKAMREKIKATQKVYVKANSVFPRPHCFTASHLVW